MRPNSSIGSGSKRASPNSTSSPASSRASTIERSVAGFSTSSTTTFEAESSIPVSAFQSTWMSSPERNCFLAAARTASFIASITRSRSIPCSWQSASMFCAIDELMKSLYLSWLGASRSETASLSLFRLLPTSVLLGAPKFLFDVYFQVCFRYQIQRHAHAAVCPVFKNHFVAVEPHQTPPEIALAVDRLPGLQLRVTTGEAFVIGRLIKPTLQPGRRYFQCVGSVDEVFHIQNGTQVCADFGTILVGYTLRLVNKYTDNRLVLGACNFRVHQLEAMVDCHLFSQFLNPCRNRIVSHATLRPHSRPKKKVGANPPDKNPCLRASCELYVKGKG